MTSAFDIIDARFKPTPTAACECCGSTVDVRPEGSRTMYHFEGVIGSMDDPNRDVLLCRPYAQEHHEHWDAMWAEYYAGLL